MNKSELINFNTQYAVVLYYWIGRSRDFIV